MHREYFVDQFTFSVTLIENFNRIGVNSIYSMGMSSFNEVVNNTLAAFFGTHVFTGYEL